MSFTQMAFSPTTGLRDTATYPTQPASEADLRDSIQDQSDQLRDYLNNTLLPSLESSDAGSSGAASIGCEDVDDITGTTVQAMLQSLKDAITALSLSASGLTSGIVETDFLANLAVTAAKLAVDAVETLKIKDAAVTTDKIADDAVTVDKLADNSVGANQIIDGSISQNKIAAGAVTASKIANGTITYAQIANNTISNDKLATGAVTTTKILDLAVTPSKLDRAYVPAAASTATITTNTFSIKEPSFSTTLFSIYNTLGLWYATATLAGFGCTGNFSTSGGGYDGGHLVLGGYHIFVGDGKLRIKYGVPTSATDGTVVGTQS